MKNKNLIQTLREIGMTSEEAEEEIRQSQIKQQDIPDYQIKKQRQVYDILCSLNSR